MPGICQLFKVGFLNLGSVTDFMKTCELLDIIKKKIFFEYVCSCDFSERIISFGPILKEVYVSKKVYAHCLGPVAGFSAVNCWLDEST